MMNLLGLAAGILGILAYIPYIRDILRHQAQPDRISWGIWLFEYAILFLAQAVSGARGSLWLIGLQLIGVVIISALSVKYGTGRLDRQKLVLLGCAGLAMAAWAGTKDASLAIYLLLVTEGIGMIPTVIKTYKQPDSETLLMWTLIGLAGILAVPAVGSGAAFALYVYPLALALINFSVVVAATLGRRKGRASYIPEISSEV